LAALLASPEINQYDHLWIEDSGAAAALSWGSTVQVKMLYMFIPIVAVVSAAAIGIGIGLINLEVRHAFDSAVAPVISAGALTILIMIVATILHMQAPDPE
jgi:hypothetical protein